MTPEQFKDELSYQVTLLLAKQLQDQGLITVEEFEFFKESMMVKYQPIISRLSGLKT